MKNNILIFILALILLSCNKKEKNTILAYTKLNNINSKQFLLFHLSQDQDNCSCFKNGLEFVKQLDNKNIHISMTPNVVRPDHVMDSIKQLFIEKKNVTLFVDDNSTYFETGNYRSPEMFIIKDNEVVFQSKFDEPHYDEISTQIRAF